MAVHGGYYDGATKLVKLGQRYYDPSLGRFMQRDPRGGGYGYASDNPVNFTDPSGLENCNTDVGNCAGGISGNGGCGGCDGGEPGGPIGSGYSGGRAYSITFGTDHASDHLIGTGLSADQVEPVIATEVRANYPTVPDPTSGYTGFVNIGDQTFQYRTYVVDANTVNVGTYFPVDAPLSNNPPQP